MSLRSRIALAAALLVLAAVLVNTLLQTFAARWALVNEARENGARIAEILARTVAFAEGVPGQVEEELGGEMLTQARLVAQFVAAAEKAGWTGDEITARLRDAGGHGAVEFLATDADGRAYIHTDGGHAGGGRQPFVFSPDAARQPQAHVFWRLLEDGGSGVVQEARRREIDDRIFKYVGVGGVDGPRIVQVGREATFLGRLDRELGVVRLVDDLLAGDVAARDPSSTSGPGEGGAGRRTGGDIRAVRILDARLATVVGRQRGPAGAVTDLPEAVDTGDAALARDCIASARAVGRLDGGLYRVAAPVRRRDGQSAGAVLLAISAESSRDALWWQAVSAILAATLVGLPGICGAIWLATSLVRPVRQAVAAAEAIASGDLTARNDITARVEATGGHEVGRLLAALGRMTNALGSLIGRIQAAGTRLAGVEADTAAALARQDRAVRTFSGSAQDVSNAVAAISATSEQLLAATGDVTAVAREAARVADEGRGGLEGMTASMQQLDESLDAFSRKLATISQRAAGITSVVTTIAKVADQTNLLSVNATIEAEKAGESGRGFRIVAQEIRRLADQTALATKDIERMVRDMQAAVSSGTMEMDRFRNEVSGRIGEVAAVSEKLGRIIEPVQEVTRSLDGVHEGMQAQSRGARQIRDAMESLRDGAGESAASVAVFSAALDELRRSIDALNAEAATFRTAAVDASHGEALQPATAAG
jgi:methyl-accepting chemotaxis protein